MLTTSSSPVHRSMVCSTEVRVPNGSQLEEGGVGVVLVLVQAGVSPVSASVPVNASSSVCQCPCVHHVSSLANVDMVSQCYQIESSFYNLLFGLNGDVGNTAVRCRACIKGVEMFSTWIRTNTDIYTTQDCALVEGSF